MAWHRRRTWTGHIRPKGWAKNPRAKGKASGWGRAVGPGSRGGKIPRNRPRHAR
jgi:hypothetical protein